MNFLWDGSYIGNINNLIISFEIIEKYVKVKFTNCEAYVFTYVNSIPIIADEIKPLFGLIKIGIHYGKWGDKDIILYKIEGEEKMLDTLNGIQIEEVQRAYIFRWALGFSSYGDDILLTRKYKSGVKTVTSYMDLEYNYDPKHKFCSKITKSVINKWFYNSEAIDNMIKSMFKRSDLPTLRNDIDNIIRKIDPNHIAWSTSIICRLQNYLN